MAYGGCYTDGWCVWDWSQKFNHLTDHPFWYYYFLLEILKTIDLLSILVKYINQSLRSVSYYHKKVILSIFKSRCCAPTSVLERVGINLAVRGEKAVYFC